MRAPLRPTSTVAHVAMSRGTKALLATSIGVSMSAIDTTIVNVARDTIAGDLNASDTGVSWVLSGYSIVFAAVLLTSGRLADRYGRKRIYDIGLLTFIGASAACGFAPTVGVLIAARVAQAIGAALIAPAALALVLPEFPVERRSSALAVWGIVGSTSAAAGPILGSLLIDAWNWRAAFFVNVPVGLAGFLYGQRVLHDSRDESTRGLPDVISIVCGVGAVGVVALAFTESNSWGFIGPRALIAYAIAGTLLPIFVWRCRVARLPVLDLSLLRSRSFSTANAAGMLFSIPFYGSIVADVSFLQRQWNYSVLGAGLATAFTPLVGMVIGRPAGRYCDIHGHRVVLVPAALSLAAASFLRAGLLTEESTYWTRMVLPLLLTGVGLGVLIPGIQSATVKYLRLDRMAMGSAFYTTVRQLGAALGVAITVAMLQHRGRSPLGNFRVAWLLHGIVGVVVALVIIVGYRPPSSE